MVDFSNAKVLDLAVHIVGNKSKDEEIILTETPAQTEEQPKNNQYVETQPNMSGSIFDLFR